MPKRTYILSVITVFVAVAMLMLMYTLDHWRDHIDTTAEGASVIATAESGAALIEADGMYAVATAEAEQAIVALARSLAGETCVDVTTDVYSNEETPTKVGTRTIGRDCQPNKVTHREIEQAIELLLPAGQAPSGVFETQWGVPKGGEPYQLLVGFNADQHGIWAPNSTVHPNMDADDVGSYLFWNGSSIDWRPVELSGDITHVLTESGSGLLVEGGDSASVKVGLDPACAPFHFLARTTTAGTSLAASMYECVDITAEAPLSISRTTGSTDWSVELAACNNGELLQYFVPQDANPPKWGCQDARQVPGINAIASIASQAGADAASNAFRITQNATFDRLEIDINRSSIAALHNLTADLRPWPVDKNPTWSATTNAHAGVAEWRLQADTSVSNPTSLTWNTGALDRPDDGWQQTAVYVLVELSPGQDPLQYRVVMNGDTQGVSVQYPGHVWQKLTVTNPRPSGQDQFQYYAVWLGGHGQKRIIGHGVSSIVLEVTSNGGHIGQTSYGGDPTQVARWALMEGGAVPTDRLPAPIPQQYPLYEAYIIWGLSSDDPNSSQSGVKLDISSYLFSPSPPNRRGGTEHLSTFSSLVSRDPGTGGTNKLRLTVPKLAPHAATAFYLDLGGSHISGDPGGTLVVPLAVGDTPFSISYQDTVNNATVTTRLNGIIKIASDSTNEHWLVDLPYNSLTHDAGKLAGNTYFVATFGLVGIVE